MSQVQDNVPHLPASEDADTDTSGGGGGGAPHTENTGEDRLVEKPGFTTFLIFTDDILVVMLNVKHLLTKGQVEREQQ